MKKNAKLLPIIALVVLFNLCSIRCAGAESLPYLSIFSPNTGEIISPTDDSTLSADLLAGDLYIDVAPIIHFLSDADINLMFGLHYSSGNPSTGALGAKWSHTYDIRLVYNYNNGAPTMSLTDTRGRSLPFVQPAGSWVSQPSFGCYLTATVSGTPSTPTGFTVTDKWGRTVVFDATGLPIAVTDYFGRTTTLTYNAGLLTTISDSFGRSLGLVYTNGFLTSVVDNTVQGSPQYIALSYNVANLLSSFSTGYAGGATASYNFSYVVGTSLMATYTDPDGGVHSFTFTGALLSGVTDPLTNSMSISYAANQATVTDRVGAVRVYYFSATVNALVRLDHPTIGGTVYSSLQTYDSGRNLTSSTEPGACTWNMTYDTSGNLLTRSTSYTWNGANYSATHTWTFNASNLMTSYADPNGSTWNFDWFGPGRIALIICPDDNPAAPTHSATVSYDANGFPTTYNDYNGNTWTYVITNGFATSHTSPLNNTTVRTCNNHGQILTEADPLGNTTSYNYDNCNRMVNIIRPFDANGNAVTTYTLSAYGRLIALADPTNATTNYSLDAAGRLVQLTDALANSRTFSYDNEGSLAGYTDFRANQWSYSRDSWGRAVALTDPLQNSSTWAYGIATGIVTETDRSGVVITRTFDPQGRLNIITDALGNTITYTFDAAANITAITDQRGNTTLRAYDSLNRAVSQTDPLGFVFTISYDFNSSAVAFSNRANGVSQRTFDAENRLVQFAGPDNAVYGYEYDAAGNLIQTTKPSSGAYVQFYNAGRYLVTRAMPSSNVISYSYDLAGRLTNESDTQSSIRNRTRDALGRITAITYPDNSFESYGYDADGNIVSYTDCVGNLWTYTYDAISKSIGIINPSNGNTSLGYDAEGRLATRLDAAGVIYNWLYDSRGLMTSYGSSPPWLSFSYDAAGNLTAMTDPLGSVTSYAYNARNERISETDALNNNMLYGYDAEGNLAFLTDPNGNTTSFAYDLVGNRIAATDALNNADAFTYFDGMLTSHTDRNGKVSSYSYDNAGRMVQESFFDPFNPGATLFQTFTYDLRENVLTENGPYASISRTFDNRDRMVQEQWSLAGFNNNPRTISYAYDANDNMVLETDFSGRVMSFVYDGLDSPTGINDGGQMTTLTYDASGRLTQRTLPSGQYEIWSYLPASNQMFTYSVFNSGGVPQEQLTYNYDASMNVISKTSINGWMVNYTHDAHNRLTNEVRTGVNPYVRQYTYDGADNMTTTTVNGTLSTYTYDAANNMLSEVTGGIPINYSYDANGNLVADSNGNSFVYDYLDRLAGYSLGATSWQYYNTTDNRRVAKLSFVNGNLTQTDFTFWDFSTPSCVYRLPNGGVSVLTEQYCSSDIIGLHAKTIPPGRMFAGYYPYLKDEEGNVIGVVDFAQVWRKAYEYTAFGTLVANGGQTPISDYFRYKSTMLDSETGAYNMYQRMFQPRINRYTQATNLYDFDITTAAFLKERPVEFVPEGGYYETSASMMGDIRPATSLPIALPDFSYCNPAVLHSDLMQWHSPFALHDWYKTASGFRSIAELPTSRSELEGMYISALNNRLRLRERLGDSPAPEIPVLPIAVEDDDFGDNIEDEIEVF